MAAKAAVTEGGVFRQCPERGPVSRVERMRHQTTDRSSHDYRRVLYFDPNYDGDITSDVVHYWIDTWSKNGTTCDSAC